MQSLVMAILGGTIFGMGLIVAAWLLLDFRRTAWRYHLLGRKAAR